MVFGLFTNLIERIQKNQKQYILTGVFFVGISIIAVVAHNYLGDFFINNSYDILVDNVGGKNAKAHKDVQLLLIDENTLRYAENQGIGRWPWGREVYQNILAYLNSGDTGPKGIFFDILFSEQDFSCENCQDPKVSGADELFSMAVAESGNVYHNVLLRPNDEKKAITPLPVDIKQNFILNVKFAEDEADFLRAKHYNEYTFPLPCLRSWVSINGEEPICKFSDTAMINPKGYQFLPKFRERKGYPAYRKKIVKYLKDLRQEPPDQIAAGVNVALFDADSDGVNRRGHILFKYGKDYMPSLSLSAIRALQGTDAPISVDDDVIKVGNQAIPVDRTGNYLVNYYSQKPLEPLSMTGVFSGADDLQNGDLDKISKEYLPSAFDNKIIIIGCSAVGCSDLKNTPLSENTPGPLIHATMISNILQGNEIHIEGEATLLASALLLIFIVVSSVILSRIPYVQLGVPFVLIFVAIGISAFLFHNYNYLQSVVFIVSIGIFSGLTSFAYLSMTEGAERRKYSKILGNMIDPSIVSEALEDLDKLKEGGEEDICAFFSDVASFSTISEKLTSKELAALLNDYLSAMTKILKEHGGTLDKYIGDAIVGIFGAPIKLDEKSLAAARASIDMVHEMEVLRAYWVENDMYCQEARDMNFRIGLNTGIAKVGFMGTDNLASYTMMGDTVNLAARLEAAGKDYGVKILISEYTFDRIKEEIRCRELDAVVVKGKTEPVTLYEIVESKDKMDPEIEKSVQAYEEGFHLYKDRKFGEAITKFEEAKRLKDGDDLSADLLMERCKIYEKEPPPEDWDGTFVRTHK